MRDQRIDVLEIVGIIAVVFSLAFVGYEIRQNTIASRAAAYQAIGIAGAMAHDSWAHGEQIWRLQRKKPEDMNADDWERFAMKMKVFARLGETVHLQVEQGLLPPDAMERLGYRGWEEFLKYPKTACIWPLIRPEVGASFREFVEANRGFEEIECSSFDIPRWDGRIG
jgi:hypothetical protein